MTPGDWNADDWESERLSPRQKKYRRAKLLQPRRPPFSRRLADFALVTFIVLAVAAIYIACIALACIHR